MKKIGLLVIHGIGTSKEEFDAPFKSALFKRLRKLGYDPEEIAYRKVFWAEYINERQKKFVDLIRQDSTQKIGWGWLRNFVINNMGDASAYMSKLGQNNKNYFNIIRKIQEGVRGIKEDLVSDDKPLLIFAHSLGGFIINNYIWDAHKIYRGEPVDWPDDVFLEGNFENMVNVAGIVTFGCNIPLFVTGHDPIQAIDFPHAELNDPWKSDATWLNFYDPDDVLGWPLRQLKYSFDEVPQPSGAKSYADVVNKDIVLNLPFYSGWFLSWSPASHIFYWQHKKFIKPSADFVAKYLMKSAESAAAVAV